MKIVTSWNARVILLNCKVERPLKIGVNKRLEPFGYLPGNTMSVLMERLRSTRHSSSLERDKLSKKHERAALEFEEKFPLCVLTIGSISAGSPEEAKAVAVRETEDMSLLLGPMINSVVEPLAIEITEITEKGETADIIEDFLVRSYEIERHASPDQIEEYLESRTTILRIELVKQAFVFYREAYRDTLMETRFLKFWIVIEMLSELANGFSYPEEILTRDELRSIREFIEDFLKRKSFSFDELSERIKARIGSLNQRFVLEKVRTYVKAADSDYDMANIREFYRTRNLISHGGTFANSPLVSEDGRERETRQIRDLSLTLLLSLVKFEKEQS